MQGRHVGLGASEVLDSAELSDECLRREALSCLIVSPEEMAAQEFGQGGVRGTSGEKFRKGRAQGAGHNEVPHLRREVIERGLVAALGYGDAGAA